MQASLTGLDRTPFQRGGYLFGTRLLLVNGTILAFVALVAACADLAGHFLNLGPLGPSLYQNPDAIGFFEAHGLALLVAVLIVINRNASGIAWNIAAGATHLFLGASNVLFWPVFVKSGLEPMGIATTAMHAIFFILELIAALWRNPALVTGPGALFRVTAALTIVTGVTLHISRLPLGPQTFQQTVFTPVVDSVFAVPMTIAGISGALLWRRAILPSLWEKIAYAVVVVFFMGSLLLHAKTVFTWDTSYVNVFPAWYPIAAMIYLSLIGGFAVTRRFQPARAS